VERGFIGEGPGSVSDRDLDGLEERPLDLRTVRNHSGAVHLVEVELVGGERVDSPVDNEPVPGFCLA
jgi:hypothetical protein